MGLFLQARPLEPRLTRVKGEPDRSYYLVPFGEDSHQIQVAIVKRQLESYSGDN